MEKYSCCRIWSLDLDQEVVGGLIVLDSSRCIGETAQVPDGHGSWSCKEIACCEVDASENGLVKRIVEVDQYQLGPLELRTSQPPDVIIATDPSYV